MRAWIVWVSLLAVPAWANDDLAEMNAVSKTWDRYAELSSQDKAESIDLLAASSLKHLGFLRDMALYASAEQLRRLPAEDRIKVYLLRATQNEETLRGLDEVAVARLFATKGWIAVRNHSSEQGLPQLAQVTVIDDRAVAELAPATETNFQFGPDFVRENGQWKYRLESAVPDASLVFEQSIKQSGVTPTQMAEYVLGTWLQGDGQPPRLALLDRPLADDAGTRTRLNEIWPDYTSTYHYRIQAIRRKAEINDSLAQFVIGSMMISGNSPEYIQKDETQGLQWLERASDNGHAMAAAWVADWLLRDPSLYDDAQLKRALPHVQRAANASNAKAMSVLASFYFDGVGGLPRDCRQAAEWQARAEEAGLEHARNELVWTWATCPIPEQRDPAKAMALAQYMVDNKDKLGASELDTLAAAYAANKKFDEAIAYQNEAIGLLGEEIEDRDARSATLKRMRARLNDYRKGRDYVVDYKMYEEQKAGRY